MTRVDMRKITAGLFSVYSGFGQPQASVIVKSYGGDPENMFGKPGDPDWLAYDVVAHADALRGTAIYLSSGSGIPGVYDIPGASDIVDAVIVVGPIAAVPGCAL